MISINWHPSDRELRQFAGIWFPAFWAIVAALVGLRTGAWDIAQIIVGLAVLTGIVGLVRPHLIRPLFIAWMIAAFPIGWTISHALLAAVYYLLISPLGLILRATGRDKLNLRLNRATKTYWMARPPPPPASRYFRQF